MTTEKIKAISLVLDVAQDGMFADNRFAGIPDWKSDARQQRSKAGWTSIRVDRTTATKLRELRTALQAAIGSRSILLAEALTIVANARLETITIEHAAPDVGKKRAKRLPPILKEIDRLAKAVRK